MHQFSSGRVEGYGNLTGLLSTPFAETGYGCSIRDRTFASFYLSDLTPAKMDPTLGP